MRMRFMMALCLGGLFVIGCSSSTYLADKPLVLYPQTVLTTADDQIQTRSMKALLDAFSDNKWEIRKIDNENGIVLAEVCRRGEHCAEVQATVNKDGSIEIIRTPGQKLSEDEGVLLQRWLGRVKNSYEKHMKRP